MLILVGITGGIAAYKSAQIVRSLTELGHDVKVLPTQNALKFIGSATLEALSHNSIDPDLYTQVADVKHIKLAQEADLVIVAPATAAFLARYANGIADDLLLNVLMATTAPVVIAPAMHTEMWNHPATQRNLESLQADGVHIISPTSGRLTGNDSGIGRMAEPEDIVSESLAFVEHGLDLSGKTIVVAAGGTREPIDEVRFIGNSSSGKQGIAIAVNARNRGAKVTLIAANIDQQLPNGVDVLKVSSHSELQEALESIAPTVDALIMPAAVSDFRVDQPFQGKLHRGDNASFDLKLIPNSDILAMLVKARAGAKPVFVGFAAEVVSSDEELLAEAKKKLESKGCDLVVANNVSGSKVFGSEANDVLIVDKAGYSAVSGHKDIIAKAILDKVALLLNK